MVTVGARETKTIRLRLSNQPPDTMPDPLGSEFSRTLDVRQFEADEFYVGLTPKGSTEDEARVMRQAMAGMLWSKQSFNLNVDRLAGGTRR